MKMAEESMVMESLQNTIRTLSITIGERHLGSEGERKAQDWIEAQWNAMGYEVVREAFPTPGWRCGASRMVLEGGEKLEAAPCYFSPGGSVRAPLEMFWTEVDAATDLKKFAGKVAFAGNYNFAEVADTNALAERLEAAGAAAFIINSPYNDTVSTKIVRSPNLKRMPVFTVSQRTALRLAREEGRMIDVQLEAECFEHRSCNLVARHRAEGESKGKLVIGAHYDTSPGIPGALDNASGVAVLFEMAHLLKGQWGDWDVDLVAFGGEEYGGPGYGIGGYMYHQEHAAEPIRAMICLDGLGSYLTLPEARVGRSSRLRSLARQHASRSRTRVLPFRRGSDQGIFHDHGIPTIWYTDGGAANGVRHYPLHSPQDAEPLIDYRKLENLTLDIRDFLQDVVTLGMEEPPAPECRKAGPEDLENILELVAQVWTMGADFQREKVYGRVLGNKSWRERITESVRNYLELPEVTVFKTEADGRLAGFTSCRIDAETGLGEIGYNAVDPQFLGRGYGKYLLEAALQHLREAGIREVEVATGLDAGHAPARAIYEAAGFQPLIQSIRYTRRLGPAGQ